jgi:Kyakuja-Dileera-Zisupton transposase
MHCILCMDGNFENKRCACAGKGDQPLPECHSFFIPADIVSSMANIVDMKRKSRNVEPLDDDADAVLPGLRLQNHVFDGCSDRFVAAKESNQKASSSIFSDTGLMALTCRHDRIISMVNLRDAGEKQYNAIALLQQLFEELPEEWNIGVLYDIGCQLHKSITKVSYN